MKKYVFVLFILLSSIVNAEDVTSWTTGAYTNSQTLVKELHIDNATKLKVKITGRTEASFDFVYILDQNNNLVAKVSGVIDQEIIVDGSLITAKLIADDSGTDTGVTVTIEQATSNPNSGQSWTVSNYNNMENLQKRLSVSGANKLKVTIEGTTEANFDILTITDSQGSEVKRLSGSLNESFIVDGSFINASFTSDDSTTESGFTVHVENFSGSLPDVTTWTTGAYSDNDNLSKDLRIAGLNRLKVKINGQTEANFDFVYIYNNQGTLVKQVSGNINEEFIVNGSSINAKLISDGSVTDSGVTVTISRATTPSDTTPPVITLNGAPNIRLAIGTTYTDAGASANDNVDGDISSQITVVNPVNTSTAGTYTVTYNVTDSSGNQATEVTRRVVVVNVPDKTYAFMADEHNTNSNPSTGQGSGNRIIAIDLANMSIDSSINVPGIAGHHSDSGFNSKIYSVPKESNFVNVIELKRDANNHIVMNRTKQITLIHKPRSGDAYNDKYHMILMAAKNRPMGTFIDTRTDEILGTIGAEVDCTLTDGTSLLSHADANTLAGALKHQCSFPNHGGDQISGHPYWLTDDLAAIVDRTNKQISVYRVSRGANNTIVSTLVNRVPTRTSAHQIVPRNRKNLPASQQNDFYLVEEGEHTVSSTDYHGGIPHALVHLRLNPQTGVLSFVRRMDLQRTQYLPKVKADRILNSCISIYRNSTSILSREQQYSTLFQQEGITRSTDQEPLNDFPIDCFYPGIPGGHNADFAPNNKHIYVPMAGGALSIIDVNKWKIVNNMDIGQASGPGHIYFSGRHDVALTLNHADYFTRAILHINSDRPIIHYATPFNFPNGNLTTTYVGHSAYIDKAEDYFYCFFTNGGVVIKMDLNRVVNNPTNGSTYPIVDTLNIGGIPIQGSFIELKDIYR